ncbi:MAG: RHS repeat-associated core domain-containing protein [Nanoarchaeota archaeon]
MKTNILFIILIACIITISISSFIFTKNVGKAISKIPILAEPAGDIENPLRSGTTATSYVYGKKLLATKNSETQQLTYFFQDTLGSNRLVLTDKGLLISKGTQYPFGKTLIQEGFSSSEQKYLFTGKEYDEPLYYFGARYYNPRIGRFTSTDPLMSSFASYDYAANNPFKYIDPTGMEKEGTEIDPKTKEKFDAYIDLFHARMEQHKEFINQMSWQYGIPVESIMGAILVEDARVQFAEFKDAFKSEAGLKAYIRRILQPHQRGRDLLKTFGHDTTVGMLWVGTELQAKRVLGDERTEHQMREERSADSNLPWERREIEGVAITLAAHRHIWEQAGYDIYSAEFQQNSETGDQVDSFAERVGLHVTLYNIYDFGPAYGGERGSTPKANPGLGGTRIESLGLDYGHLASYYTKNYAKKFN